MRVTLIHNATAGDEEHSREWLEGLLDPRDDRSYLSMEDGDWRAALDEPADLVVAAGGDGTVADVFRALAGGAVPVAVVPLGSANNIARSLGVADVDPAWLARAAEGVRRRFDIGRLTSSLGDASFVESLGGGVFADLLHRAEVHPADPDGEEKRDHGLRLLREAIAEAPALGWGLTLDGRDLSGELLAVQVMNIREIGPTLPLAPEADPGDGLLDVVLVRPQHRDRLEALVGAAAARRTVASTLPVARGRRLEAHLPAGCRVHVDDDPWPTAEALERDGHASVAVGAARVEVVVPAG
jgi:diacylglycerol kinase family enzyme